MTASYRETEKKYHYKRNNMKKKICVVMITVVVAMFAGYNIHSSYNNNKLPDLLQANIEALAGGESDKGFEYPTGAVYSMDCNVRISKWVKCSVTVITCQGGGNGCNSKKCPTHP